MSAADYADRMMPFIKRWAGIAHYAIMGINEALATILPATVAAGAATLVGWQGVEQMIPRFNAINTTAEALGGAYGMTAGSYLGTGSALQRYQNIATGGVYELGGAGINLTRMGAGSFGQMGLSTIAMLDRGVADMQLNMQQRGTMGTLGGVLGGGTDYLRQFGDVGSNIGNIFLGLAPHLPGVGGDYLSALEGITGGLAGGIGFMNQHHMGDVLGGLLASEAGWRVGTPMLGLAGRGIGNLGNLAARFGLGSTAMSEEEVASIAARMGLAPELIDAGGTGLAGLLEGAGAGIGTLAGPEVAGLALSAFLGSKLVASMPSSAQRQVAGLQAGISQAGFSAAFHPLAAAITTTTGLASGTGGGLGAGLLGSNQSPGSFIRFGQIGPTSQQVYANAASGFSQTMGDLINAGPQLVSALQKAGLKGVTMADAFQVAQNSLLDLSHAFDSHGNLNKQATQMLKNYVSAIGPMTQSAGGFNAAIAAQQIMAAPAMQDVSKINQAMDSMTQVMSGGPAGMATLFGMLGGTPTTVTHGGMKLAASPAISAMAKALTSFTTASGAGAWNTFAGSQGLIAAEQQNLDQLRTYMTLGSIGLQGKTGAQGIAGFQLQQLLPMARQSPAALAMLMQQGAQMGITGYYNPAQSQGQNFAAAQKALAAMAGDAAQVNKGMNAAVIASSNLPKTAMQFTQGLNANIQSQQIAKAAQDVMALKAGAGKETVAQGALKDLTAQFQQQGLTMGHGLANSINAALKQAGVSGAWRENIVAQLKLNVNAAQAKAAIDAATKDHQTTIKAVADVAAAKSALANATAERTVHINAVPYTQAAEAAIAALTRPRTVQITAVMNAVMGAGGSRAQAAIAAGNIGKTSGFQTGGMVPGSGNGDIIPAMLEPGEAIIPRYLVPLIAPILAAHRVPGFGGMPQSSSSHFAAGGLVGGMSGNVGKDIAYSLIDGITSALKSTGAQSIATALVNKIGQEISYAKQTASSVTSGLNLGGMDLTQGAVLQQMQNYAASSAAFGTDLATLRKDHLAKGLISQLVAAGPVQGDLLAQSILGSGVGAVNKVWGQIGHSANAIGAQAAMSQYGGYVSPNLRSAGASQTNVTVNVNASGSSGSLNLTAAQIKQLVEAVQAALLKQARRNQKTGLQLSGKGA